MKKKHIYLIVGIAVAGAALVGFRSMKKKQAISDALVLSQAERPAPVNPAAKPYTIQVTDDPVKAVYLVLDGVKYAFVSPKALTDYGYIQPTMITAVEFAKIPAAGWVEEGGKVVKKA